LSRDTFMSTPIKTFVIVTMCLTLQGCLGTVVGATADVAIEVVKIPFKVGGAVVDVVNGDDSETNKKSSDGDND